MTKYSSPLVVLCMNKRVCALRENRFPDEIKNRRDDMNDTSDLKFFSFIQPFNITLGISAPTGILLVTLDAIAAMIFKGKSIGHPDNRFLNGHHAGTRPSRFWIAQPV